MKGFGGSAFKLKFAVVAVYGILIPLLLSQFTSAHPYAFNSVRNGRLDYTDDTRYNDNYARERWNAVTTVRIAENSNPDVAEIHVYDIRNCSLPWLGEYDPRLDIIRFNLCAMEWQGGRDNPYPGDGRDYGPTTEARRTRSVVHEFGHAMALNHNGLDQCNSVMRNIRMDHPDPCTRPGTHDVRDMERYWP